MGPSSVVEVLDQALPISGNVVCLSVSDTAARFAIPTSLAGKVCTVMIDGTDCDVLAGSSTVDCAYGTASSVSTETITVSASTGWHLEDGVPQRLRMPKAKKATHISVDCKGSGSGKLYIKPE